MGSAQGHLEDNNHRALWCYSSNCMYSPVHFTYDLKRRRNVEQAERSAPLFRDRGREGVRVPFPRYAHYLYILSSGGTFPIAWHRSSSLPQVTRPTLSSVSGLRIVSVIRCRQDIINSELDFFFLNRGKRKIDQSTISWDCGAGQQLQGRVCLTGTGSPAQYIELVFRVHLSHPNGPKEYYVYG